ncbi:MAG TPA: lipase maturation factor family protein [Thermoanaerobaculia bacterium]
MQNARVASPPPRPLMIFDGDCGFCRRWIGRWKAATGGAVDYAESQQVGSRFPEIPEEAFARAVQLVLPDGEVLEGAEAVYRSLAEVPRRGWLLAVYRRVPGFAAVSEIVYSMIARHRRAASAVTKALWGKTVARPTYRVASSLFVRLVGACYLAAFVSLWTQVDGLIGSNGILPVGNLLDAARSQLGGARWTLFPTLSWIDGSDGFLHFLCGGGALAALFVILGFFTAPALLVCWAFYLSLSVVAQEFLQFQWDLLLLETGFLAIFLAPIGRWRLGGAQDGPRPIRLLLLWLLFRLMFSSGWVKLASHDPTWRNLSALTYHYWTQPLPSWTAWYMSQEPVLLLRLSCLLMFVVELGAPFLIVAPRRLRLLGCAAMVGLQAAIALTGNYAFFNFLTIALCLLLVDDGSFPERTRERAATDEKAARGGWPRVVTIPVAAAVLLASLMEFGGTLRLPIPWPGPAISFARAVSPFRSVGSYGLFMVMTTSRPEIILEGSDDGAEWKAYEFRWKPGDVTRRPRFVAPHQPRLDWQMWFAALGRYSENPWFLALCGRLLQGKPDVTGLLAVNPFPNGPPRYLRAVVYEYRFTDSAERRATGAWWKRGPKGLYLPVLNRDMLREQR